MTSDLGIPPATTIAGTASATARSRARGSANTYLLAAIALLLAIGILYIVIGGPNVVPNTARGMPAAASQAAGADGKLPSVGNMVDGLKAKLDANPDDGDGWLLLAKSYHHLGRIDDARDAYARAVAHGSSDAAVEAMLNAAEPAEQAGAAAAAPAAARIHGRVAVSAEAAATLSPSASVFVVAKAGDGSPMPLAVIRKTVADLPFEFELNDDQSMVRGRGLSSSDRVIVSAKISSSGDALKADPGLEASSGPVGTRDDAFVDLRIDPGT